MSSTRSLRRLRPLDDAFVLGIKLRALRSAIYDQKCLVELVPMHGIDPRPYESELARLKLRLIDVQKQMMELE